MNIYKIFSRFSLILLALFLSGCEDFLEVETPNYLLDSKTVFANDDTAEAALQGIFNQLFNTSFSNGGSQSVSFLGGLSADTYTPITNAQDDVEFYQNKISPENNSNLVLWSDAYNVIYQVNALLEGIKENNSLSPELVKRMEGSSKFIRAFTYFYLVNLYGDVPLILKTNYRQNALASRTSVDTIYEQIIKDLEDSAALLDEEYKNGERTSPNRSAALAMLARVNLFLENWEKAELYSSQVIEKSSLYEILDDPNEVFLANSHEAIWQISPIGWGNSFTHTRDGNLLTKTATSYNPVVLSNDLINAYVMQDKRYQSWINPFESEGDTLYYPNKYKIQFDASGGPILEYSMVLRFAEQYLIRAEARARMGNDLGAIEDLNKIKARAGTSLIDDNQENLTTNEILKEILLERRREFFGEWAHRWLDLKRFDESALLENKTDSNWTLTSNLWPIPFSERQKDPNLTQNPGY